MMAVPFSLIGKNVLVAGATSDIGAACARLCAAMGASLILTGRDSKRLAVVCSDAGLNGSRQEVCDLVDACQVHALVDRIAPIDGLVYSVGMMRTMPAKYIDLDEMREMIEVNCLSAVSLVSALQSSHKLNRGASIVFMSSVAALHPEAGNAMYSAAKAALDSYARSLALELSGRRVRVNCVSAGMVRTRMLADFDVAASQLAAYESKYPLGFGSVDDVANAIVYLLSDASKWVTGTSLVLDGGFSLR